MAVYEEDLKVEDALEVLVEGLGLVSHFLQVLVEDVLDVHHPDAVGLFLIL